MIICLIAICCLAQAEGDEFRLRDRVKIHSLTSPTGSKLNGLTATVVGTKTAKGRYGVRLEDGTKRRQSIRPDNLELQGPNPCASTDAPKLALLFGMNTAQDELRKTNEIGKFAKLEVKLTQENDDILAGRKAATQIVEPENDKHAELWRLRETNPESFRETMRYSNVNLKIISASYRSFKKVLKNLRNN